MRAVKYVRLHEGLFLPGIGDLGRVLDTANQKFVGMKMNWTGTDKNAGDLTVTHKGVEAVIPGATVSMLILEPEEKTETKKK